MSHGEQEAPLTLRRQRGRCRNIKGNPKYGSFLSQRSRPVFLWVWFHWDFGKPQVHAKFEVVSFSHCVNIEVKSQNIGEFP